MLIEGKTKTHSKKLKESNESPYKPPPSPSGSLPYFYYARCIYCDSAFNIEHLEVKSISKVEGVSHDRVSYQCPACASSLMSFVFKEQFKGECK